MGLKQSKPEITKRFFIIITVCMLAGILLTRGYGIKHNFMGQPDEHVFYGSTEILMYDILYGDEYEPLKPYPEGTYVFRLPFHLLAQSVQLEEDYTYNVRLFGRISSVFYYSLGCVFGLWLVVSVLGGGKAGAVIYALTSVFSLFQIEISRYGTFDPLSHLVLMMAIFFITKYIRSLKIAFMLAAAFCIGVAAAGKYSLAYFILLPLAVLVLQPGSVKYKLRQLCLIGIAVFAGFVLFSPSVIKNPRFFIDTVFGGMEGYIVGGNPEGYSTIPESFFSALVYQLFYSDLPLCTVFVVICVLHLFRNGEATLERKFFSIVLPVVVGVFLFYNCLLTTFFLRTLFPYYCLCSCYAAAGLGRMCNGRKMRLAAIILCMLMVLRSAYFVSVLGDTQAARRSAENLQQQFADEPVKEVLWLGRFFIAPELDEAFSAYEQQRVSLDQLMNGDFPEIQPGQLVLTDSMEHGWAKYCLFAPNKDEMINLLSGWERFKEDNSEYYVGSLYPDYYYWLFGYWVHGSTATNYEFPNSYLYYKAVD